MTKREKIRILKAMLPLIDTTHKSNGICGAYWIVVGFNADAKFGLSELGIEIPEHAKDLARWAFWYSLDSHGDNQRRAAIRRAIKKLQAK